MLKYIFILFVIILFLILFTLCIYIDFYRYSFIDFYSIYRLEEKYKCKKMYKDCIITLTTIPERIAKIRPALLSLLDQSVAVSEIRINVPYTSCKGEKYIIPHWLTKLKYVKIYRHLIDRGPATKLLPTLLDPKTDNKKIIVVDDDVIYGSHTIENLITTFNKYNKKDDKKNNKDNKKYNKTAVTMYGDCLKNNYETNNSLLVRVKNYLHGETYTDIMRGHSGYMVDKSMFTEDIYNYHKYPKECFFVDDNYLSYHLKRNGVKILMVGANYCSIPLPELASGCLGALHDNENANGNNEKIVNLLNKKIVNKLNKKNKKNNKKLNKSY